MKLYIKKLSEDAIVPRRCTEGSAGYDLSACLDTAITLRRGETAKIPTKISIELKLSEGEDAVALIYARSSLATKYGIAPSNCVGVVDRDYRGEIFVALTNHGAEDYTISSGDRIAQLVIAPVFCPEPEVVSELSATSRGDGGFGSTGK